MPLLVLCPYFNPTFAQTSIRTELSPESGSLEDLFLFTVTIEQPQQGARPQISTSSDFDVQLLGPRNVSVIINGVVRTQQSFVYQLSPKRSGTLKTPEVQMMVDGKTLSAPSRQVIIRGPSSAQPPSGDRTKDPIFINQTATPSSVYVGQQIVNAITVYTNVTVNALTIEDGTADGFWEEAISSGNKSQKSVNGQEYATVEVTRALFPLRAGKLLIPQRTAIAKVPVRKQRDPLSSLDPFSDDFFEGFFQRTIIREKKLASQELSIDVKALPVAPAEITPHLRGIPVVGGTSLAAHYSDTAIKVGESKNISLIVTSEGNLNPLKSLPLRASPGLKIYEGQVAVKHDSRGATLVSQKTFSFSVVPLEPGIFKIPGPSLAYFDPESNSYKLTTTQDITFVATGTAVASQSEGPTQNGNEETTVSTPKPKTIPTMPPLPMGPPFTYSEPSLIERISERISIQLALLVFSLTLIALFASSLFIRSMRSSSPTRSSISRVSQASSFAELESAIRAWSEYSIPGAKPQATFDELRALIRTQSDSNSSLKLLSLLDEIELGRYSGRGEELDISDLKRRCISCIKERT